MLCNIAVRVGITRPLMENNAETIEHAGRVRSISRSLTVVECESPIIDAFDARQ